MYVYTYIYITRVFLYVLHYYITNTECVTVLGVAVRYTMLRVRVGKCTNHGTLHWCRSSRDAVCLLQCAALCCSALECATVCCSALQCDAVRCIVLQSVVPHHSSRHVLYRMLQCVAVRCIVLQSVVPHHSSRHVCQCSRDAAPLLPRRLQLPQEATFPVRVRVSACVGAGACLCVFECVCVRERKSVCVCVLPPLRPHMHKRALYTRQRALYHRQKALLSVTHTHRILRSSLGLWCRCCRG